MRKRITKRQVVKKKGKTLNTQWINNAMKSIGSSSANVFKEMAPTLFETGKELGNTVSGVKKAVSGKNMNDITKQLSGNKFVSLGKKAIDNAIADLKSGNFNNEQRADDAMVSGILGDGFDDLESMFSDFDDGADSSVTFNYIDDSNDQASSEATLKLAESIDNSTAANLKASKATIDSMIAVSSAGLLQNQEIGNSIIEKLGNIDNTLSALLQYHQDNTTQFYEASMAAFERFGSKMDDGFGDSDDKSDATSVLNASGSLNIGEYKKYVKKSLNDAFKGSALGSTVEMITSNDQLLEMAASNPLGFATEAIIRGIVPTMVSGTIKNVEDAFAGFMPTMLRKLSDWRNTEEKGFSGNLKKIIGQVFGINIDRLTNVDISDKVSKDAAVFDGLTRNAIVEVVPKYLRESTAYLKEIADHFKVDTDKARKDAEIYDPTTNSYMKVGDLQKSIAKSITETVTEAFDSSDFGKAIRQGGSALEGKDAERYKKYIDQFFVMLERSDTAIDFGDPSKANNQMNEIVNLLDGDKKDRALLMETIKQLRENQSALHTASAAQLRAQSNRNKELESISADYDMRNILASGINNETDIDKWIDETMGYQRSIDRRNAVEKNEKKKEAKDQREAKKEFLQRFGVRPNASKLVSAGLESGFGSSNFNSSENAQKARFKITDDDTDFVRFLKGSANHVRNGVYGLMTGGDPKQVMAEFSAIFTDQMKHMWEGVKEHFFKPLGQQLFGTKDDKGYSRGGILSGTQNKIKDMWKLVGYQMNGKGYVDSEGVEHPDKSQDENNETVIGRMKGIFKEIGDSVKFKLFGEDKEGEDGDKKKKGIVNTFTDSLSKGLAGWKEALFGGDDDKDIDETVEDIKKNMVDAIPDATVGATAGAIMGGMAGSSLFGTIIGGPIGGAVVGMAGGLLSRSESFKEYLFGPKDPSEEGKRLGGLISRKTQDLFSNPKMKKSIIGGAALGVVKNMVFGGPGGIMGMLVGGPIGGALMGAGFGLLKESTMFQEFLYGNDEKGRTGLIRQFNSLFGKKDQTSEEAKKDGKKMFGMASIGAIGGGLTAALVGKVGLLGAMVTPFGPIGGALAGLAIGIKAQNGHFKEWLFGKEDPDSGKKKGGMIQKFASFIHVEVLSPMKVGMQNLFDDMKLTMEYKILEPIRLAFIPFTNAIAGFANGIKDKVTTLITDVGSNVKKNFIEPMLSNVGKIIFDPLRAVVKTVGNTVYEATKSVVTLPFKLMTVVADAATSRIRAVTKAIGKSFKKYIINPIAKTVKTVILNPMKKLFGGLFKMVGGLISTPFKVIGGVATYLNNKTDERRASRDPNYRNGGNYRDERHNSRLDYKQAKAQARIDKRKRTQLDENRRQMARILGYDEMEFTEENMKKAEQMAALKGMKKPKWKKTGGLTFDETAESKVKSKLAQMSNDDIANQRDTEQDVPTRQLSVTQRIFNLLQNRFGKKGNSNSDSNGNSDDLTPEEIQARLLAHLNGENNSQNDSSNNSSEESNDGAGNRSDIDRIADDIENQGGLLKYAKNRLTDFKNGISIDAMKEAYNDSDLKKGINKIFKRNGQARANGGDADEDQPILVGDGGTDPDAAEIFVPTTDGTVLSQKNGGIKVFIEGISQKASRAIGNAMPGDKDGVGEVSADFNDISSIASSASKANSEAKFDENGNVLPAEVTSGSDATLATLGAGSEDRSEKEQEAMEDAARNQAEKEANQAELADARNAHSFQAQQAQKALDAEAERENRRDEMMAAQLEETRESNKDSKSHFNLWSSIFSKKGLITGALIAAIPLISNFVKNLDLGGVFKNAISSVLSDFGFGNANNTNGKNSIEKAQDEVEDAAELITEFPTNPVGATWDYIMGDDGYTDAKSGAKANFMYHQASKIGKKVGKVAKVVDKVTGKKVSKAVSKKVSSVKTNLALKKTAVLDNITETAGKVKDNIAGKIANFKTNRRIKATGGMHDSAELPWRKAVTGSADDVGEAAGKSATKKFGSKVAKKAAGEGLESGSKSLLSKALSALSTGWDNIMSGISGKLASKSGKLGSKIASSKLGGATKGIFQKVAQCLSKNFAKVSGKIAAIIGGDAALTSTGVGAILVAAKNVGMAGILGINEASNPRNLFYVNSDYDCDWIMYAIAAGIGMIKGTTPGSVIDIVNELVASILGLDFIHEIACVIYNLVCNALGQSEKYEKLQEGKDQQKKNYEDYKNSEIEKQYSAYAKSKGMSEDEYTMEQYKADIESGAATLDVDSFVDYNHKQNKTIGAKATDAVIGAGKKISNGWKSLRGYTTSTFYDESTGITYEKNEDDTYTMYDKDGKNIGTIAEDNVDTSKMKETKTEHKGVAGKTISAITNTIHNTIGDAGGAVIDAGKSLVGGVAGGWKSAIGGGINGVKQAINGDIIGGIGTVASGVGNGFVTAGKGVVNAAGSLVKGVGKTALNLGSGLVNTAKGLGEDVLNIGKGIGKGITNFFTSESEEVYRNPEDGSYYKVVDGKWILHNNNGDKLSDEALDDGQLISLVRAGTLVQDKIMTRKSGLEKTKDAVLDGLGKAKDAVGGALKKTGEAIGKAASWVGEKAGQIGDAAINIGKTALTGIHDFFTSETADVYRNPEDGSYYQNVDGKWILHNNNGDKISNTPLDDNDLISMVRSGTLVQDTITTRKSGLEKTKDAVLDGLGKAKDAVGGALKKAGKALGDAASWVGGKATKAVNAVGNFAKKTVNYFTSQKKEVYMMNDGSGSFYDVDGKHYTGNGERLPDGDISKEELSTLISNGLVTKTERQIEPQALSDAKSAFKKVSNGIKSAWSATKKFAGNVVNSAKKAGKAVLNVGKKVLGTGKKIAYKAILTVAKEVYMNADGSYYDGEGKYYTAQGERVEANDISQKELYDAYKSGAVTKRLKPDFSKVKNFAKSAMNKIVSGAKSAWNGLKNFGGKFVDGAKKLGKTFGKIGDAISEKGVFGAIGSLFETKTKEAWYAPDGSYYTLNKDGTYNHYSATNDLLQENISGDDASDIDMKISSGVFKKDTITEQSAASSAISGIKDTISKGWENAKNVVSSGWENIKNGLSGIFGGSGGFGGRGGFGEVINNFKDNLNSYIPKRNPKDAGGFGPEDGTINGFKYYSQKDSKWANAEYDSSKSKDSATMGEAGCGPTAMAMVASQYSGKNVTPVDMAKLAESGGFRDETGTNSNFISYAGNKYNLQNTRVDDPGSSYIKSELAKGNSVVLNGISGGMPNSPFTSKGHYVVAVGTDKQGNILVNDPRGAGYSTAYSPETIQNQTRMAWSFSKPSKGDKVDYVKSKNTVSGGGKKKSTDSTSSGNWLAIVEAVKKAIASQKPGYSQSRYITITVNGKSMKARTDCSGFVGTCLKYYGVLDEGINVTSRTFSTSSFPALSNAGFTHMSFSNWESLQAGDIISLNGHVEIFAAIKDGKHYVYNCGSDSSVNNPNATVSGHSSYTDVWRPSNAGSANGSVSTGSSTDSSSSSSESTDAASIITSHFSAFANKAMNGVLTGNWDNDFSSLTNSGTSSSSSDSSSSNNASAANISGSNTAEKVWNFFTSNGYSPQATAGIMGNFQQESSMNPACIQGNGKGPAAGIAQWENYNTKSSRWKAMSDYATKKGYKWTDLEPQLEFVHKELQNLGTFWKYAPNMQKAGTTATTYEAWKKSTDVDTATRQFEGAFERAGKPMMDNRLAAAKKYYSLYNGKTGGKGGDDVPLSIKDINGIEDDPILAPMIGGFGEASASVDDTSTFRNEASNASIREKIDKINLTTQNTTDTTKMETLMSKMITILESIDSHSGESVAKLKSLDTSSTTNVKSGDNIIVQQSSSNPVSEKRQGESRNTVLANKIARGY